VAIVDNGQVKWAYLAQLAFWGAGGLIVIALAASDVRRRWTPDSALLLLWTAGALLFAVLINWTVSGRNILPMLPAAMILLTRRLEARADAGLAGPLRWRWLPIALSLAVAFAVARADWQLADSARQAASLLTSELKPRSSAIAFEGHWGFQYYMEEQGAVALDRSDLRIAANEAVIVPAENVNLFGLPGNLAAMETVHTLPAAKWISVMDPDDGAGYYSDAAGPLPFVFCAAGPQYYLVYRGLGGAGP
jgi:hypothetical protein